MVPEVAVQTQAAVRKGAPVEKRAAAVRKRVENQAAAVRKGAPVEKRAAAVRKGVENQAAAVRKGAPVGNQGLGAAQAAILRLVVATSPDRLVGPGTVPNRAAGGRRDPWESKWNGISKPCKAAEGWFGRKSATTG